MKKILMNINNEIHERANKGFITAFNMEVEKDKARNQGEIIGLELAKQIIQAEPMITLNKKEIDNVIGIRTDGKYCSFIDGYKITVENQ